MNKYLYYLVLICFNSLRPHINYTKEELSLPHLTYEKTKAEGDYSYSKKNEESVLDSNKNEINNYLA